MSPTGRQTSWTSRAASQEHSKRDHVDLKISRVSARRDQPSKKSGVQLSTPPAFSRGRAVTNSKLSYERSKQTKRRHQPTSDGMRARIGALEDRSAQTLSVSDVYRQDR